MLGRIIDIADDNRHLSLYRGFLVIEASRPKREELKRIPLDDIAAVIVHAQGVTYTNNILVALAQQGAPFVLCAQNHNIVGVLWAIDGNYEQSKRIDAQLNTRLPKKKQIWAKIVKSKLEQQAAVLAAIGAPDVPLSALISKVKSGDPENVEAQGARRYWKLLFGDGFKRDRDALDANSLLNYGYTVLRASTARAIVAAGLHPSIGLHHSNASNALRLVDDLMEPFRPLVDFRVYKLFQAGVSELTNEAKIQLIELMYEDMDTISGRTPVTVCLQKLAISVAKIFLEETSELELPLPKLPVDVI